MNGMYVFCDDNTPPRVLVLGNAGSGKTAFIELTKKNWKNALDYMDLSENENPMPEFIEASGFDFDLGFAKDELGDDVAVCVCICHDISTPLTESEELSINEIIAKINDGASKEDKMLEARIVLTKSDSFGGDLKSVEKEFAEKFGVPAFAISKNDVDANSRFYSLIGAMGIFFVMQRLNVAFNAYQSIFKKTTEIANNFDIRVKKIEPVTDSNLEKKIKADLKKQEEEEAKALEKLADIFRDTKKQCMENPALVKAIEKSSENQFVLLETCSPAVSNQRRFDAPAKIFLSKKRTFEAARKYKGENVCVLNFANPANAGGGVEMGATGQEESLCRCSTLFLCLDSPKTKKEFYSAHFASLQNSSMDYLFNDDCIFTPDVVVFKSDAKFPEILPESEWFKTSVITCAAPLLKNCENGKISKRQFTRLVFKRGKRIFELAKSQGAEHLVLGAFGCGAFGNPPELVARAYRKLSEDFKFDFKTIEFAVYCPGFVTFNYATFRTDFFEEK